MSFSLPINNEDFYSDVTTHCYELIEKKYWDKINKHTLDKWLSNFESIEEKYLASQILLNFQYRNEQAMLSLFKQIVQIYLPQKLEELGIYSISSIKEWENTLSSSQKSWSLPFRFSTIIKGGRIGESGDALFRMLARNGIVHNGIGRFIKNIKEDIKTVILVDDIAGSGEQFKKFYNQYEECFEKFNNIIYCPLVAHEEAIRCIGNISKKIHILPAEKISKENSFYNIHDSYNSNETFIEICDRIIKERKLDIKFPYGFKKQAILYCLNISTPNNNHSFIYHNENWNPLAKR